MWIDAAVVSGGAGAGLVILEDELPISVCSNASLQTEGFLFFHRG